MIFEKKKINLKDGRACILRPAEAKDAEAMVEWIRIVSSETPFLLRNEDEVTYTVEAEALLLETMTEETMARMKGTEGRDMMRGIMFLLLTVAMQ